MKIYLFLLLFISFQHYFTKKKKKVYKIKKKAIVQNAKIKQNISTKNQKSDHIFACIVHSKNCFSYKYNALEVIWQYLYLISIIAARH